MQDAIETLVESRVWPVTAGADVLALRLGMRSPTSGSSAVRSSRWSLYKHTAAVTVSLAYVPKQVVRRDKGGDASREKDDIAAMSMC